MQIKPYEKNAKEHPDEQIKAIARSIKEFGWQQPIKVGKDNVIIAGHGRYYAYTQYRDEYNLPDMWIVDKDGKTVSGEANQTPLDSKQEKAYRLADNQINAMSKMDDKLVIPELKDLDSQGFDITLTGYSRDMILEPEDKDDDMPELPVSPRSKLGDLYELGEHRILCGDSTSYEDLSKLMNGQKADMVFTDPPYNVDYKGKGKNTSEGIMNDKMSDEAFDAFLVDTFTQTKAHIKTGAGCYIFHSHKTMTSFKEALESLGFIIDTQLIWNKPSAGLGANDYRTKHEPFFYAYLSKDRAFYGDRTNTTVWKIPEDPSKALEWWKKQMDKSESGRGTIWTMSRANVNEYVHPTQKPVELPVTAMFNSSKEGDIILDQFLGSGSTLIAAEKTGRKCYGLELDPQYMDAIVERYVNYTGNKDIILNGQQITWQSIQEADQQ